GEGGMSARSTGATREGVRELLERIGLSIEGSALSLEPAAVCADGRWRAGRGEQRVMRSPIDGSVLGEIALAGRADVDAAVDAARASFERWRDVPAPRRAELVRLIG